MAYTYDDFVKSATNSGMMDQFDDDDLATAQKNPEYGLSLLSLKKDYNKATTDEQKLLINTAAEQLRNSYGLTGTKALSTNSTGTNTQSSIGTGTDTQNSTYSSSLPETGMRTATDGTDRTQSSTGTGTDTSGSFTDNQTKVTAQTVATTETPAATETGATDTTADTTTADTTATDSTVYTRPEFTYDQWEDPSYQAYRKEYLRNANRATADALGQNAAASAGRASSYAVNAATQAGDYYATQLSDKVPELYQDAYDRFNTEQDNIIADRQNAYNQLTSLISSTGYMPTAEELQSAGMNQEMADSLYQGWIASNPDTAWANGLISAKKYRKLTGQWPAGYNAKSGKSKNPTPTDDDADEAEKNFQADEQALKDADAQIAPEIRKKQEELVYV